MQIAIGAQIGYQAGAGGEVGVFDYLIRDEFTTDLAAGSVDGTDAEPGPGRREITDSENKISISGGKLLFASGRTSPSYADPYAAIGPIDRVPGRVGVTRVTFSTTSGQFLFGGGNPAPGTAQNSSWRVTNGALEADNAFAFSWVSVGSFSVATIDFAVAWRSHGGFYLRKVGSNWLLYWMDKGDDGLSRFAFADRSMANVAVDFVRVPAQRWLPVPLVSDGFSALNSDGLGHPEGVSGGLGSGGDGVAWTGSAWSVASGVASNTPVKGSDLSLNGNLEEWNSATDLFGWTEQIAGSTTINQEATELHGGSYAARFAIDASNNVAKISQNISCTTGDWLLVTVWAKTNVDGRSIAIDENFGSNSGPALKLSTTYTPYVTLIRATKDNTDIGIKRSTGTSANLYIDDISIQVVTLTSLLRTVDAGDDDVLATVAITRVAGSLAGLVIALDSVATPANFILVFLDGSGYVRVAKVVAGTYTPLASTAITYSAGAELRVIKSGSAVRVYYNNALVGSELTISDAGIINNTLHGLFSTDAGNTFDNFTVYARGTAGDYDSVLDAI
ncbi:MAG: hypothetical protein R2932_59290 [Caldilineaceae bacterium]